MPRPLRFCFFSIFYPPYSFGGDAIFVSRLTNALARRGHEVDVIHCVDSYRTLAKKEPVEQFVNHPNVTVHSLRSRLGRFSPLIAQQTGRTWPKTDAILEVFYSKKFDVIHYHNISLFGRKVLQLEPDYRDFIKLYTTHEHWLVAPCTCSGKTTSVSATSRSVCVAHSSSNARPSFGDIPACCKSARVQSMLLFHRVSSRRKCITNADSCLR